METIKDLINKKRALTIAYKNENVGIKEYTSILDFSSRTVSKIIQRMLDDENLEFGCCICGWNDTVGDIHHINGRKIPNADGIKNLSYLCPNCHRKVHRNLIKKEELISFDKQVGDKWKKYALTYKVVSSLSFKYREEISKINKKIKELKVKDSLDNLKNSNIDFSKYGWVKEASEIICVTPQKVGKWLKREDPQFYEKCYKRNRLSVNRDPL